MVMTLAYIAPSVLIGPPFELSLFVPTKSEDSEKANPTDSLLLLAVVKLSVTMPPISLLKSTTIYDPIPDSSVSFPVRTEVGFATAP